VPPDSHLPPSLCNHHALLPQTLFLPVLEKDTVLRLEMFDHDVVNITSVKEMTALKVCICLCVYVCVDMFVCICLCVYVCVGEWVGAGVRVWVYGWLCVGGFRGGVEDVCLQKLVCLPSAKQHFACKGGCIADALHVHTSETTGHTHLPPRQCDN
jgi:hypothetical protein